MLFLLLNEQGPVQNREDERVSSHPGTPSPPGACSARQGLRNSPQRSPVPLARICWHHTETRIHCLQAVAGGVFWFPPASHAHPFCSFFVDVCVIGCISEKLSSRGFSKPERGAAAACIFDKMPEKHFRAGAGSTALPGVICGAGCSRERMLGGEHYFSKWKVSDGHAL